MSTQEDLLQELHHKDEDIKILEIGRDGSLYVETDIDLPESEFDQFADPHSLTDEALSPSMSPWGRVIRTLMMTISFFSFITMTLGFIPYYILSFDEHRNITFFFVGSCSTLTGVSYIILCLVHVYVTEHPTRWRVILGLWWGCTWFFFVGTFAAAIRNITPLQGAGVTFLQSLLILVYITLHPRKRNPDDTYQVDGKRVFIYALMAGLLVWLVGLYVFVTQRDWLAAIFLFLFLIGSAAYITWQTIRATGRYNISRESQVSCVIDYVTSPVIITIKFFHRLFRKETPKPKIKREKEFVISE